MKLNCYIVRDLLPSYIENLTGDETKEDIGLHLKECRECREIYEDMASDTENKKEQGMKTQNGFDYLKKIKEILFRKIILVFAVLIFVFLRLTAEHMVGGILMSYEFEFYILLVSGVFWYAWKDLFRWERGAGRRLAPLYLLHLVIFLLSCTPAFGMWRIVNVTGAGWEDWLVNMGPKMGFYIVLILRGMMVCMAACAVYGLYASVMKSGKYYSLVCHSLGSLEMLYYLFSAIMALDLSSGSAYGAELMGYAVLPYAVGILLMGVYFLYCIVKDKRLIREGERKLV